MYIEHYVIRFNDHSNMKKKITHHSLAILVIIVSFGLVQAWRESRNPFAFNSTSNTQIKKSRSEMNEPIRVDTKKDNTNKLYFKE